MPASDFKEFIEKIFHTDQEFRQELEQLIWANFGNVDDVDLDDEVEILDYKKGSPEIVTISVTFAADVRDKLGGGRVYGKVSKCEVEIQRGTGTKLKIVGEPIINTVDELVDDLED